MGRCPWLVAWPNSQSITLFCFSSWFSSSSRAKLTVPHPNPGTGLRGSVSVTDTGGGGGGAVREEGGASQPIFSGTDACKFELHRLWGGGGTRL